MPKRFIVFLIAWGWPVVLVFAQYNPPKPNVVHFGQEDGLSHRNVRAIAQDENGFLWIGTQYGLNRFDGKSFTQFLPDPLNPHAIAALEIREMTYGKSGLVWIGFANGKVDAFDWTTNSFQHFQILTKPDRQPPHITVMAEFSNGDLLVGTIDGQVYRKPMDIDTFQHLASIPPIEGPRKIRNDEKSILHISETPSGKAWIAANLSMWIVDLSRPKPVLIQQDGDTLDSYCHFVIPNNQKGFITGTLVCLEIRNNEGLWLTKVRANVQQAYDLGLQVKNTNSHQFYLDKFDNSILVPALINNQILTLNPVTGEYSLSNIVLGEFLDPGFNISIIRFFEGSEKVLWIGTNAGLFAIKREKPVFGNNRSRLDSTLGGIQEHVRGITTDHAGNLWVGANPNGALQIDVNHQKVIRHVKSQNLPGRLRDNVIWATHCDPQGTIWVGGNFLYQYDPKTGDLNILPEFFREEEPLFLGIHTLASDQESKLWIGGSEGLFMYDQVEDKLYQVSEKYEVNCIWVETEGTLLLGTRSSGLLRFSLEQGKWEHLSEGSRWSQDIRSIYRDRSGRLWLGTAGSGLLEVEESNLNPPQFHQYSISEGLPDNVVYGILEAGVEGGPSGELWMSTNQGLARFDPQTNHFFNYDVSHGLPNNEFNSNSWHQSEDGRMFFGGLSGIVNFDPGEIPKPVSKAKTFITQVSLNQMPMDFPFPVPAKAQIRLEYDENDLSFEFISPQYRNPEKVMYAFKLEGLHSDWQNFQTQNTVHFVNIPPGEYIFRVKATNPRGFWEESTASVAISISEAWWRTNLAYVTYFLLLILALVFFWRLQLNRIRMRAKLEQQELEAKRVKEVDAYKTRFFTNITHEFRTPLMLILGPIDYLKTQARNNRTTELVGMLERNGERLLNLINHMLDLASADARKLKLEVSEGDFLAFARGQLALFESLADEKQITIEFETSLEELRIPFDREKLEMVMGNVIGNAMKFTPIGGLVSMTIEKTSADQLQLKVRDTGPGIPEKEIPMIFDRFHRGGATSTEVSGTGLGLSLVKELVTLHQGSIRVESTIGTGTEVSVFLPTSILGYKENEFVNADLLMELPTASALRHADFLSIHGTDAEKLLILLIEDNEDVRILIRMELGPHYRLLEASNGEAGLEMASRHVPDLIISDIMMPGIDGYEVVRRLKVNESTSHIPLILLTAKPGLEAKLQGLELGADNYLEKPFVTQELQIRIRNLIENRKRLREHHTKQLKTPKALESKLLSREELFLFKMRGIVEEHLDEAEFSVEQLAEEALISRSQLHRKLKALTGMSPSVFMRTVRLEHAHILLAKNTATVSEVAWQVGFSSHAYFTKCFTDYFSYPPSTVSAKIE